MHIKEITNKHNLRMAPSHIKILVIYHKQEIINVSNREQTISRNWKLQICRSYILE